PAPFCLATDRSAVPIENWWDTLEASLLSPAGRRPPALDIALPDGRRPFPMRTADERETAHPAIYHAIVGAPSAVRDQVIRTVVQWRGRRSAERQPHRRMTVEEIRDLAARDGHAIGAHTARHLMLPRQPVSVQRQEIDESRRVLETLLDRPVRSFAYPFGAFSDETVRIVRDSSFELAVTCEDAVVCRGADPMTLPRLDVTSRSVADFAEWLDQRFSVQSEAN